MIAAMPEADRQTLLAAMRFSRFTPHTIMSRRDYENALEEVRKQGYAADHSEEEEGISCIAAAILDVRSRPIGAIWITGPSFRIAEHDVPVIAGAVQRAAATISGRFGHGHVTRPPEAEPAAVSGSRPR
jgi:DNA-binding IclR family transcriptional regulator